MSMKINKTKILDFLAGRKILILSLAFLLVASPLLYSSLRSGKKAEAAWWDETWLYRKVVQVNNNTSTQNNVYIALTINTSDTSKFQSDCGDIRFTKQNGQLLNYYIVSGCGTSSALIHVNLGTFPSGSQTIYYYYGNPSALNGFSASDFSTEASNYTIGSTSSEEQSPGPGAYWKFDEGTGTTTYDSTVNKNNGIISGASWQTEDMCVAGKCLYFDGTDDVVTVSNSVGNIKTVSFWVKPITTSEQFIDLNGSAYIQSSSGTISATGFTSPTIYVNGKVSSTIESNKWQHVVVTTNTAVSGSAVKIAQISSNYGQVFIDEVKLYPYARSAAQVLADYNAGKAKAASTEGVAVNLGAPKDASAGLPSSLSEGLVGYWKMDEGTGTTIADSSGLNYTGTLGVGGTAPTWTTGKFGSGLSFNGGQVVQIPVTQPSSMPITFSFWIKPKTGYTISGIFDTAPGVGNVLRNYNGGLDWWDVSPFISLGITADDNWHHIVAVYSFDTKRHITYYHNGQFVNSVTGSTNSAFAWTTFNLGYGNYGKPDQFKYYGTIDEVRIYNRALSPAEVRALYEWAPGPVAHFKLDDGSGTSPIDSSGFGRTGSIINGIWSIGKYGKGLKLDGSGDYLEITDF